MSLRVRHELHMGPVEPCTIAGYQATLDQARLHGVPDTATVSAIGSSTYFVWETTVTPNAVKEG